MESEAERKPDPFACWDLVFLRTLIKAKPDLSSYLVLEKRLVDGETISGFRF